MSSGWDLIMEVRFRPLSATPVFDISVYSEHWWGTKILLIESPRQPERVLAPPPSSVSQQFTEYIYTYTLTYGSHFAGEGMEVYRS